jgi:GNAT superfamily N-acetyltransferase
VLGALYVRADRHRQGIGRQLVNYLYSTYNLDEELVIVQTRAISEGFYNKLGWTTVGSTDVDLSEWGGKGMGYGTHRSPQMLRYPK